MSYNSVHWKLWENDPAVNHICECGRQAKDWAYQHNGNPEVYDEESGRPYSKDPACYKPMCRSCHFKLDTTDFRRRMGQLLGRGNALRAQVDEEFAAKVSEDRANAARVANRQRRQCNDCGLVAHPAAMGAHLKGSGHTGYAMLSVL